MKLKAAFFLFFILVNCLEALAESPCQKGLFAILQKTRIDSGFIDSRFLEERRDYIFPGSIWVASKLLGSAQNGSIKPSEEIVKLETLSPRDGAHQIVYTVNTKVDDEKWGLIKSTGRIEGTQLDDTQFQPRLVLHQTQFSHRDDSIFGVIEGNFFQTGIVKPKVTNDSAFQVEFGQTELDVSTLAANVIEPKFLKYISTLLEGLESGAKDAGHVELQGVFSDNLTTDIFTLSPDEKALDYLRLWIANSPDESPQASRISDQDLNIISRLVDPIGEGTYSFEYGVADSGEVRYFEIQSNYESSRKVSFEILKRPNKTTLSVTLEAQGIQNPSVKTKLVVGFANYNFDPAIHKAESLEEQQKLFIAKHRFAQIFLEQGNYSDSLFLEFSLKNARVKTSTLDPNKLWTVFEMPRRLPESFRVNGVPWKIKAFDDRRETKMDNLSQLLSEGFPVDELYGSTFHGRLEFSNGTFGYVFRTHLNNDDTAVFSDPVEAFLVVIPRTNPHLN